MNARGKLIRKIAFTPATHLEGTVLEDLVCEDERSLFGDKAYDRDSLKIWPGKKDGIKAFLIKVNKVTL